MHKCLHILCTPSLHEPSAETVGSCDIDSDESGDVVNWRCTANAGVSIICLVDGMKLEDCICKFILPPSFLPHSVTHSFLPHSVTPSSLTHSVTPSSLTQSLTLYFLPSLIPSSLTQSLPPSSLTQSLTLYFLPYLIPSSLSHSLFTSFLT